MNKPTDSYIIKGLLTNYGFCIKKALYSQNAIKTIKTFFTVKPKIMFDDEDDNTTNNSFDVFFEDDIYIVIPKFLANSHIKSDFIDEKTKRKYDKISFSISKTQYKGTNINFKFTGKLRDYQMCIVNSILKNFGLEYKNEQLVEKDQTLRPKGGIIQLSTGAGKCLAKDTGILMFDGTIKKVQDILVGDLLMGDDSTPRTVLSLARGREKMYKICIDTGIESDRKFNNDYVVNESHILSLKYKSDDGDKYLIRDIGIKDYLKLSENEKKELFGYRVPVSFNSKEISIDSYTFGKSLMYYSMVFHVNNLDWTNYLSDYFNKNVELDKYFKTNGLYQKSYIPDNYKYNTEKERLNLLAGIIDGNNIQKIQSINLSDLKTGVYIEFRRYDEILIKDIIYLIRSLGLCLEILKKNNNYLIKICNLCAGKIPIKICQLCAYSYYSSEICNHNKAVESKESNSEKHLMYKFSLKELPEDEYYGFEIDGNKRFILQDFTVTHNTVLAIYLAYILKLKTLIIVHQEFLQDQWIERFKMFTDAKIGTIRGTIIDTENKDVVIGMLQSISMKDYEDNVFKDFGLVIYDEVHHFGSKVFSRALMKTSAKYNIGLSATPERMDGLIKVVKWFTGDILYKMEKKYDYKVLVKKIYFRSNDVLYKEKKNWIKGQMRPNHIKMTENIMNNNARNKLMINAIDCLKSMGRTIFVISSRVEHLQILKNGVDLLIAQAKEQHIYNTYYYIGPTKKGEKKMAEKDGNIIFATIQLASEALDIPRLDTIVLALPIKQDKTLIQSIGRILRNDKLETLTQIPVVVDISDILSIYQKWSEKRNLVYSRKNWFLQNYYWEDETYLYRGKEDKKLKPMNIIFDDIEDEDFIEKNLIIKPEDIIKEKELILEDENEDDTSSKTEKKIIEKPKAQYVFKGKNK